MLAEWQLEHLQGLDVHTIQVEVSVQKLATVSENTRFFGQTVKGQTLCTKNLSGAVNYNL